MRWLIRTNLLCFLLAILVSVLPLETSILGRVFRSIVEILTLFIFPGMNISALLHYFFKRAFSPIETLAISSAASIFVIPLILTIEFTFFGSVSSLFPLANAVLIFIAVTGVFFWISFVQNKKEHFPDFSIHLKYIRSLATSRDFLLPFFFYSFVALGIVSAFYPLPDLDPYYWYAEFQRLFSGGNIVPLDGYRPLFASLSYIFTIGAHIDFYAFFKYILPFSFLAIVFPISLLTSLFSHPLHKTILFLFPFINGIGISYLTLPIPQAFASIACFFFVSFLLYAWMKNDMFFSFLGGAILFFGFWYHEVLALPLALWILVTGYAFRREIFALARKNILSSMLILLILAPHIFGPAEFIGSKIKSQIPSLLHFQTNFLFPEQYVNVDGNEMGWGDLAGVGKYYLFYIGPALLILFLAIALERKKLSWKSSFFSKYTLPITFSFLIFFLLAEILPRLFSIALLPDRAWVFAGIFGTAIVPIIFKTPLGNRKLFLWMLLFGISLNIGAALYINALKKYMITEHQLASASWINSNLPENRLIFVTGHSRLLRFHSGSEIISISNPNFYYSTSTFEQELEKNIRSKEYFAETYKKESENIERLLKEFLSKDPKQEANEIKLLLKKIDSSLSTSRSTLDDLNSPSSKKNFYIYYAAPDPRNPYLDRPYVKKTIGKEKDLIFDKDSTRFKKLYSDEEHRIYLWKIL